jgi:hypothetical protein
MANRKQDTSSPRREFDLPQPPPLQRKVQFHWVQLLGVPLLMVLPILGMLGLFGETFTTERAENQLLAMQVEYATRYRHKMSNPMRVTITNLSDQSPITVTIAFDRAYLDQFSNPMFMPDPTRITDQAYELELKEMETGETQVAEVELQGNEYWHHMGVISASIAGGEFVQLSVGTTIYP